MNDKQRAAFNARYVARLTHLTDGKWQASFPAIPNLKITRNSRETLEEVLSDRLKRHIARLIVDGQDLPDVYQIEAEPGDILVQPNFPIWAKEANEKYTDYTKAEFDRVLASSKLAEDRARQNGTYALAALPILTFLRPLTPSKTILIFYLVCIALIGVVIVMTAMISSNKSLRIGLEIDNLENNRSLLYDGIISYQDYLYKTQGIWIKSTASIRSVRDRRFRLVGQQQIYLTVLSICVGIAVLISFG